MISIKAAVIREIKNYFALSMQGSHIWGHPDSVIKYSESLNNGCIIEVTDGYGKKHTFEIKVTEKRPRIAFPSKDTLSTTF